jgi:hypothetical protein
MSKKFSVIRCATCGGKVRFDAGWIVLGWKGKRLQVCEACARWFEKNERQGQVNQQIPGAALPIIARRLFEVSFGDGARECIEAQHMEVSPAGALVFLNFARIGEQMMPQQHTAFAAGAWSSCRASQSVPTPNPEKK